MARPSPYPLELRRRAVRMVAEVRPEYDTEWAAMKAVAAEAGHRHDRDAAQVGAAGPDRRRDPSGDDERGVRRSSSALKKENAELKRANEILKAAASFFAAELDRPHTRS